MGSSRSWWEAMYASRSTTFPPEIASRACRSERERPFSVEGNCWRCRSRASPRKGRGVFVEQHRDADGVRRAEGLPRPASEVEFLVGSLAAPVEEGVQP